MIIESSNIKKLIIELKAEDIRKLLRGKEIIIEKFCEDHHNNQEEFDIIKIYCDHPQDV